MFVVNARNHGVKLKMQMLSISLVCFAMLGEASAAGIPQVYLEDATLNAAGETVTLSRVPVQTSTGSIVYHDITLIFIPDSTGNLTLEVGYPKFSTSQNLLIGNFKAGKYAANIGGKIYNGVLGGPGVGPSGSTAWSFSSNYFPASATWYTGPLTLNPEYARLNTAKITSPAYAYGTAGSVNCYETHWSPGVIIGAAQTGNNLTISSFTWSNNNCQLTDYATPQENITWIYTP